MRWIIQEIRIVASDPEIKLNLPETKSYQDLEGSEPEWSFPAWSTNYIATTKKLVAVANNKVYYQD